MGVANIAGPTRTASGALTDRCAPTESARVCLIRSVLAGEQCSLVGEVVGDCTGACSADAGCPPGYFCDPGSICRPRCDDSNRCRDPDPACDTDNLVGQNGMDVSGAATGVTWCYPCLQGSDCPGPLGCGADTSFACSGCVQASDCRTGETCLPGAVCQPTCETGSCPGGLACDTQGLAGNGPNVCYQCLSPLDCPAGQGCDHLTHTCGTCEGPNAEGGPFDCPPGDICSNYWASFRPGVCLQSCDVRPCPGDQPICSVLRELTPDHQFCFGCLKDSDCGDGGARCDVSVGLTFTCKTP